MIINVRRRPEPSGSVQRRRQQRRRAARLACETRVIIMTMRGPMPGKIVDLSVTGCRILCPGLPPLALSAKLNLIDHGLELRAERRWLKGDLSGWRFVFNSKEAARLNKLLLEENPTLLGDRRSISGRSFDND